MQMPYAVHTTRHPTRHPKRIPKRIPKAQPPSQGFFKPPTNAGTQIQCSTNGPPLHAPPTIQPIRHTHHPLIGQPLVSGNGPAKKKNTTSRRCKSHCNAYGSHVRIKRRIKRRNKRVVGGSRHPHVDHPHVDHHHVYRRR